MLTTWDAIPLLDRVLDDVMGSAHGYARSAAAFAPAADVMATESEIVFHIDVPGVRQEDIDVTVTERVMSIKGTRRYDGEKGKAVSLGRAYGNFALSYTLPDVADGERVSADLTDGVLTLRVAKLPAAQPRRVAIGGGNGTKQLSG